MKKINEKSNVFWRCFGVPNGRSQAPFLELKINKKSLNKFGAVSKEVASEMAVQVRNIFDSDIGVSVTGISGPGGGTKDKPVGLAYVGYSDCNGLITKQ